MTKLDFSPVWTGWTDILCGVSITVEMTVAVPVLGCMLGSLIGIGRLNPRRRFIYGICTVYVALIRGTPLLVQPSLLFFGLSQFDILLPAFACGVLGPGVCSGAYVSEIVRGTIQSVGRGQMEAAWSIGVSLTRSMRAIILSQAVARTIPPFGNEFIAPTKNSALVPLFTTHDLMCEGQKTISVSYRSLEVYLVTALVYPVLTSAASYLLHRLERDIRTEGMV